MKVISKATSYKVECNRCASIIKFDLSEIEQEGYSPVDYFIKCPICNEHIKVARDNFFDGYSLSKNVTPVYEGGEECLRLKNS